MDDISLVVLGVHQPDQLKRILSGQTELAKSTLCLFLTTGMDSQMHHRISKLDFLTSLKVNMGVAMSFKNLACVILLLPNASYVMAGSQLQLSSDVMVDQKMKNIVVQTSYFKNKIDNTKFIRISNHTRSFPLILSLPEIKYSVIIKMDTVRFSQKMMA